MSSLITRAMKEPLGIVFREPVDPVALNIPTYFEVYVFYRLLVRYLEKKG